MQALERTRRMHRGTGGRRQGKLKSSYETCVLKWTYRRAKKLAKTASGGKELLGRSTREEVLSRLAQIKIQGQHRFKDWTDRAQRSSRQQLSLRWWAAKEGRWEPQHMSSWPRFAWSYIGTVNFREAR